MKGTTGLFRFLAASRFRLGMTMAGLSMVSALLLPVLYRSWGVSLIEDAYNGRSFSLLNQMAALRRYHPLEDFYAWAQSVLFEAVFGLVALSVIFFCMALYARFAAAGEIQTRYVERLDMCVFGAGLLWSAAAVFWFDHSYHAIDIATFVEWQDSLARSLANIYVDCASCNYPILGTFVSAGVLHVLSSVAPGLEANTYAQLFRYALAIVDGANVFLIYRILASLEVRRSLFWAGLAGVLPSSWVGAAVWGQIDGLNQLFLLVFLLWQLRCIAGYQRDSVAATHGSLAPYVIGSGLVLTCLLLTKQLAVFSIPVLACMVLGTLYFLGARRLVLSAGLLLTVVLVGAFLPDIFLHLKPGYASHLQYIFFGGGSDHGDQISGNGFNVWMFLGRDMLSPSTEPFLGPLTPKTTGELLFLVYEAFLFGSVYRWLSKHRLGRQGAAPYREVFLMFVFLLALTNLSFNVLLTGTHERYLFHFYPFMLIAYLGLRQTKAVRSSFLLGATLAGGVLYGRFVWGVLSTEAVMLPHELLAAFHLWLLAYLTLIFVRSLWSSELKPVEGMRAVIRTET